MTDSLANQPPKNSFGDLLHVSNGNAGVDDTLRTVFDGIGNATALQISKTGAKVVGDLEVTGSVVGQNTFDDLPPESVAAGANPGESLSASRSDHVHAHGNQAGGSLHAEATTSVAGFMSAGDKSKLDALPTNDALNTTLDGKLSTNGDGSAVTVLSAGGTTARTLSACFADVANAKAMGAIADGASHPLSERFATLAAAQAVYPLASALTDEIDWAAIQKAATLAGSQGGGAVYLPDGDYVVNRSVTIPDNVYVYGEAPEATSVLAKSASQDVFVIGDNVTTATNVTISSISINITSLSAKTAGSAVLINKSQNCSAANLRIANHYRAIALNNAVLARVVGVHVLNPTASTGIGLLITGTSGNDHYIRDVFVVGTSGSEPDSGFRIEQTGGTWLDTCGAIHCKSGLVLAPASGQTVEHLFCSRNAWDTCTQYGMLVTPATGGTVRRSEFVADWTCTNSLSGILVTGSGTVDGLEFIGHRSLNNQQHGAHVVLAAAKNVRFSRGMFAGNSGAATGSYHGIVLGAGVSEFSIDGVQAGTAGSFGASQGYGVLVVSGASDNYAITNNDLRGNTVGGLSDGGSGANKTIIGNLPFENNNRLVIGAGAGITRVLVATTTWDPSSIASGASTATLIGVTGAAVGDLVQVSHTSVTGGNILLYGTVNTADQVTVSLFNGTGSTLDVASGTLKVLVTKAS